MRANRATEKAALDVLNKLADLYARKDISMFESVFSPDAESVLVNSGPGQMYMGARQIKSEVEKEFAGYDAVKLTFDQTAVASIGPVALVAATGTCATTNAGKESVAPIRCTAAMEQHGGRWLVFHCHFSVPTGVVAQPSTSMAASREAPTPADELVVS